MLHEFQYVSPASLDELLDFLAGHGEQSRIISGGTDLLVAIRSGLLKPQWVVDIKRLTRLYYLSFHVTTARSIGACVNLNRLIDDPIVRKRYPILHTAGSELATFQLRNRATVIGNIVTASPCGDMSSPLLCLGASVTLQSKNGSREMPLQQFITGVKKTQIAPNEIVTRITVPVEQIDAHGGYKKLKRIKGHDLGVVSVAMTRRNGTTRVAISSAAPTPVLLSDFPSDTSVAQMQEAAQKSISPIDDVRCTKEYRSFMVDVFIRRLAEEMPA